MAPYNAKRSSVRQRRRWPPQYVSPPPTPRGHNTRLNPKPKRQKTPAGLDSQVSTRQRSSSPEFLSAGPARAPPATRHSNIIKRGSYALKTPIDKVGKTKKPCDHKDHKKDTAEPLTPVSRALKSPRSKVCVSESVTTTNVIVHFFLSDEDLGAIPATLEQCNSVNAFFTKALSAWRFLGSPDGGDSMAGVRVMLEGVQWPIIVAWGAADAFGWMMDAIAKAKSGKVDDLHVQVKCIPK